jgi:hypothetical protein
MPPAPSVKDPLNLQHLQSMAMRPPRCNIPRQVAPNVFVHFDCYPYSRIGIAQKHATPQKLDFMKMGNFKWNPLAAFGALGGGNVHGVAPGAPVRANAQSYPDMVDHRLNGTEGPIKDQGDVGACTAFALSSVIDNSLRRAGQNVTTSPEHLWSHYGTPTMEGAASGNLNKPITTFDALPYSGKEACELMKDPSDDCGPSYNVRPDSASSDGTLQGKLRTADATTGHRAVQFEELNVDPVDIDEIVATLASGADLWTAFNVDSSAFVSSRMVNFTIPDWYIPDGGHALPVSGYRKVNGSYQFLIHNSWGASWGDGGYAWVSQAMVQKWMHLAYKVRTDVDQVTPPKTDGDCPGDQVLDSVTNKCAGICPDKSRPANGQCPNGPAPGPQPLNLPGLQGIFPNMPSIPGWPPGPQPQPQPGPAPSNQPGPAPAPSSPWPWPVPSSLPPFPTALPPFMQPPRSK